MRAPLRADAADNYIILSQEISKRLDQGEWVTLEEVASQCKMAKRTAQRWWKKFQEEHQTALIIEHGKIRRKRRDDS
jgi:response regulator of citrate/malate metabolism